MYNGIGLTTPRGSGTNGYVQRNFALVRHRKEKVDYKTEEEIRKLDASSLKKPNQEILDHERKRKIELKCMEMGELMSDQGYGDEEIESKVSAFRRALMEQTDKGAPKDAFGRPDVRETHQLAEANQEKNNRLREAFGINQFYVDGSSLDPDRKAKEAAAQAASQKKYGFINEPSESSPSPEQAKKKAKKSKKKKGSSSRARSESPNIISKRKKSKKRKHEEEDSSAKKKDKKKRKSRKRSLSKSPLRKTKHKKRSHRQNESDLDSRDSSSESLNRRHKRSGPSRDRQQSDMSDRHDFKKAELKPPRNSKGDHVAVKEFRETKADKIGASNDHQRFRQNRSGSHSPRGKGLRGTGRNARSGRNSSSSVSVSPLPFTDKKQSKSRLPSPPVSNKKPQYPAADVAGRSNVSNRRSRSLERVGRRHIPSKRDNDREPVTKSCHEEGRQLLSSKPAINRNSNVSLKSKRQRSSSSSSSNSSRSDSSKPSKRNKAKFSEKSNQTRSQMGSMKNIDKDTRKSRDSLGCQVSTQESSAAHAVIQRMLPQRRHNSRNSSRSPSNSPANKRHQSSPISRRSPSRYSDPVTIRPLPARESFPVHQTLQSRSPPVNQSLPYISHGRHRSCSSSPSKGARNGGRSVVSATSPTSLLTVRRSNRQSGKLDKKDIQSNIDKVKVPVTSAQKPPAVTLHPQPKSSEKNSKLEPNILHHRKSRSRSSSSSASSRSCSSSSSTDSSVSSSSSGSKSSSSTSLSDAVAVRKNGQPLGKLLLHSAKDTRDNEQSSPSEKFDVPIQVLPALAPVPPPRFAHREPTPPGSPSIQTIPLPPGRRSKTRSPAPPLPTASKWEKEDTPPALKSQKIAKVVDLCRSPSSSKGRKRLSRSRSPTSHLRGTRNRSRTVSRSRSGSRSHSRSSRSRSRSSSCSRSRSSQMQRSASSDHRSRSPSIPRRHGSPSFLDKRRITRSGSRSYSRSQRDSRRSPPRGLRRSRSRSRDRRLTRPHRR